MFSTFHKKNFLKIKKQLIFFFVNMYLVVEKAFSESKMASNSRVRSNLEVHGQSHDLPDKQLGYTPRDVHL
jgi:hypothetical protein